MKTDNSHINEKIQLRLLAIKGLKTPRVLDCFSGTGKLWKEVNKIAGKDIEVLGIEKEKGKNRKALQGDNLKYLPVIDLSLFDVVDLDAYGIPFKQIQILKKRDYHGIIVVTCIQTGMGQLPNKLLEELGYTHEMTKKISSIFNYNGIEKIKNILYLYGCKYITGYFMGRKNYFLFKFNH
ncbi:MAG: hypothetical protein EOM23_06055 [Candidatus Moranbacteria bacterium]|nr:hypothetical protein [Candidatus Moranbacteria bacterium]